MSMHMSKAMNITQISVRAASYGIPGTTVDGNDVLAVYEAVLDAVEYARAGNGPSLIDCLSYRWRGHSKSDRNLYRTPQEIDEWKHKCPIRRFKQVLVDGGVMTRDEVEDIDQTAKTAIDRAAEEALTFPEPSPENMEAEVYAP
jgi:pyruvate dehydrogenase E1 component alpha subunit